MNDFLKWLSENPNIIIPLLISFIIILLSIAVIYIGAFIQGREISFWPPKIGQKSEKTKLDISNLDEENSKLKSDFFGIGKTNNHCSIVINHYPEKPNTMSHGDIEALVGLVEIIYRLGGKVTVAPFDKELKPPGEITEFCIGGPEANQRTQAYLANYLKGIHTSPYVQNDPESLAIRVKGQAFRYEKKQKRICNIDKVL